MKIVVQIETVLSRKGGEVVYIVQERERENVGGEGTGINE
jgi:hypothetical protein